MRWGPTATPFIPWSHMNDIQLPDAFLKRGGGGRGIRCDRHYNYTDTPYQAWEFHHLVHGCLKHDTPH